MTSVIRDEDGACRLEFGDGLPLGHELATALGSPPGELSVREVSRNLRLALLALRADPTQTEVISHIDDAFAYQNLASPRESMPDQAGMHVVRWLSKASYRRLGEFCLWNQQAQADHQAGLSAVETKLQQDTLRRAKRLVDANYLPRKAVSAYEKAMSCTNPLRSIDVFESCGLQKAGSFAYGVNEIALSNQFLWPERFEGLSPALLDTSFHEYTHAVGGTAVRGFMRVSGTRQGYRWLEEAYVAHSTAASSGKYDEVMVVDPASRSDLGVYSAERELLHILMNRGKSSIDLSELSEAYFAGNSDTTKVRRHVFSRLGKNIRQLIPDFKDSGLRGFSAAYEKMYRQREHDGWLQHNLRSAWSRLGVEVEDLSGEVADFSAVIRVIECD